MSNVLDNKLAYRCGGLLYTPATNAGLAQKIINKEIPGLTSIAICLEDSILESSLEDAEIQLRKTLSELKAHAETNNSLPLIFVRVRNSKHLKKIAEMLSGDDYPITGFIFPKFDISNAEDYVREFIEVKHLFKRPIYMMPILESGLVANLSNRVNVLSDMKAVLDNVKPDVLNIRVGGNDLSNLYGVRRACNQTIYDIGVVRDILINILNVFMEDYVVSGPVWEYFGTEKQKDWQNGLKAELELDRLNGFIGKTAIHPSQLPIINESLKPLRVDYEDAKNILSWRGTSNAVEKSVEGNRMNELTCHQRWAKKTICLAEVYGVKDDSNF